MALIHMDEKNTSSYTEAECRHHAVVLERPNMHKKRASLLKEDRQPSLHI